MTCRTQAFTPLRQQIEEINDKIIELSCEKKTSKVLKELHDLNIKKAILEGKKDYER